MIGRVPPPLRESRINFSPIAGIIATGCVDSDGVVAVVVAAGLDEGAVRRDGAGGAPGVGEHREGADGVGGDVVLHGVGGAVHRERGVAWVVAAFPGGEGDVGGAEVRTIEDDDAVGVEELHVHG